MALVTVAELKAVLGVGSLYPDADLQQVCSSADAIVTSYLTSNNWAATHYAVTNNVGWVWSAEPHGLTTGETVVISGVSTGLNGSHVIGYTTRYGIGWDYTAADIELRALRPTGNIAGPTSVDYSAVPAVKEAALTLAVDMWQNRVAPGGQAQAVDFTPSPYRMGRTMVQRIIGLLAPYLDERGLIG